MMIESVFHIAFIILAKSYIFCNFASQRVGIVITVKTTDSWGEMPVLRQREVCRGY